MRILIVGWPGSGKTTLAREMAKERGLEHLCTDPQDKCPPGVRGIPSDLSWSDGSQFVANHWLGLPAVIEGVALPRALRKWRDSNPGEKPPVDELIWLDSQYGDLTSGRMGMGKGIDTVMEELQDWLGDKLKRERKPETQKRRVREGQG